MNLNLSVIEQQTHVLVEAGERLFQLHRFADGDSAHVARLERWAEFPHLGRVVDMGCGTGEMARLMRRVRPDLDFVLVNLSPVQLAYAPIDMRKHLCDFRCVPQPDESFDAVMFCFSIGHELVAEALREAARLLKKGGVLFIYDMVLVEGDGARLSALDYTVGKRADLEKAADGFQLDFFMEPTDNGTHGRRVLGDGALSFAGTAPAIWRFIRC